MYWGYLDGFAQQIKFYMQLRPHSFSLVCRLWAFPSVQPQTHLLADIPNNIFRLSHLFILEGGFPNDESVKIMLLEDTHSCSTVSKCYFECFIFVNVHWFCCLWRCSSFGFDLSGAIRHFMSSLSTFLHNGIIRNVIFNNMLTVFGL